MLRITCLILLFLTTPTTQASKLFWGVSAISQEISLETSDGINTTSSTDDGTGFGIYADSYYQNSYRFNGTLSHISYTNFSISSLTASADYLIPINSQATIFIGATAGASTQMYSSSGVGDSAFDALYGIQLGSIMVLTDFIMLEAGYRMRFTSLETKFTGSPVTTTIDEINETYLSLVISL
ncbi:MAG: porin family protein [Gammaproteobacteria bacterium]|nr:porin family protein [Gammaproteobacteria bacterium]